MHGRFLAEGENVGERREIEEGVVEIEEQRRVVLELADHRRKPEQRVQQRDVLLDHRRTAVRRRIEHNRFGLVEERRVHISTSHAASLLPLALVHQHLLHDQPAKTVRHEDHRPLADPRGIQPLPEVGGLLLDGKRGMRRRRFPHPRVVADGEDANGRRHVAVGEVGGEIRCGPARDMVEIGGLLLDHPGGEETPLQSVDEDDIRDSLCVRLSKKEGKTSVFLDPS